MIYTDLESLAIAAAQIDTTDVEQVAYLRELIHVYFDAFHNPPQYVIGVGAITYAQEELINFQLERARSLERTLQTFTQLDMY